MNSPSLHSLEVFRVVVAERSVTRAAMRLNISQPAVSGHVRALEEWIGRKLLERTARGVEPNRWGELAAEGARAILAGMEGLRTLGADGFGGTLRVAASSTPGTYFLPGALGRFQSLHPEIEIELAVSNSAQVVEDVRAERVSLGVLGELPASPDGLSWTPWLSDRLQLVVPAGSRLAGAGNLRPRDLAAEVLLLREAGSSSRAQAEKLLGPLLHAFGRCREPGATEVIKESVIAGLGLAVLSSWATRREQDAGLISPVPALSAERTFYLVSVPDTQLGEAARRLRIWLLSQPRLSG